MCGAVGALSQATVARLMELRALRTLMAIVYATFTLDHWISKWIPV